MLIIVLLKICNSVKKLGILLRIGNFCENGNFDKIGKFGENLSFCWKSKIFVDVVIFL